MKIALLALLAATTAAAQARPDDYSKEAAAAINYDDGLREAVLQCMRDKAPDYQGMGEDSLSSRGEVFDLQRVEITGVYADDDTNRFMPLYFQKIVHPSNKSHDKPSDDKQQRIDEVLRRGGVLAGTVNAGAQIQFAFSDIVEFAKASRGELTPRVRETLAPFEGKQINEIVTHSWGCEAVYAGIINGQILPPKKLIVTGVPDDDYPKWEMLAARTGTEVHWARAWNDAVANDPGATIAAIMSRKVDFSAMWDATCGGHCNRFDRTPQGVHFDTVGRIDTLIGHERDAYYSRLVRSNVIDGTLTVMKQRYAALLDGEMKKAAKGVFAACLAEVNERHERMSIPVRPIQIPAPITPAVGVPYNTGPAAAVGVPYNSGPKAAVAIQPSPFGLAMPEIARYAQQSCASPGSALPLYLNYYQKPYAEYYGERKNWQFWFDIQYQSLKGCDRDLFVDIVTLALEQNTWQVYDRGWLESHVRRYTPDSGAYVPPSRGNSGGSTSEPPKTPTHDADGEAKRQLEELERDARLRKAFGLPPRRDW